MNNANKLTSRIFVHKSSPLSTLPLVIPEYIWIVLFVYIVYICIHVCSLDATLFINENVIIWQCSVYFLKFWLRGMHASLPAAIIHVMGYLQYACHTLITSMLHLRNKVSWVENLYSASTFKSTYIYEHYIWNKMRQHISIISRTKITLTLVCWLYCKGIHHNAAVTSESKLSNTD